MTKITITDASGSISITDQNGEAVPLGTIELADDTVLTLTAPGAWRALVCNESPANGFNVETVIRDSGQDYEAHHLKPHGGWSLGWSVYLDGDLGDHATIRALVPVVQSVEPQVDPLALPQPA